MQAEFEIHYEDTYSGPFQMSDLVLLYIEKQLHNPTYVFDNEKAAWVRLVEYEPFQTMLNLHRQSTENVSVNSTVTF